MPLLDIWNSKYDCFTELLMLELVQKIFRMYSISLYVHITWKSLNFEYLCWMSDVWKRKKLRSWRCSPISTTTAATDY